MSHYQRQLILSAPPATVYQALATQQGLRSWWTQTCDASDAAGGFASFRFDQSFKVMQIEALVPEREVRWRCVDAYIDAQTLQHKDEWAGTHMVFTLSPHEGGKTRLNFEHHGLTPSLQCFDICNKGWNQFLDSLQSLIDTGKGAPFVPSTPASSTDRVERSMHIKAPRSKVWGALTQAEEFGKWFGTNLEGQTFSPGKQVLGKITSRGHENMSFDAIVERMEPESLMSYRWHPYAVSQDRDYSTEERTLVTFTLKDVDGGTLVTVVEVGFDKIPQDRRFTALRMHTMGWGAQLNNVAKHVEQHAHA